MALTINGTTGIETNTDTGKIKVGASDDIQIHHTSGNSFIENSTGVLVLQGNGSGQSIKINPKSGENSIVCVADGATNLYHDNTKQCETSANGLAFPAGKGIDFSATSGTGHNELLSDYEYGTWTPSFNALSTGSMTTNWARYVKIGQLVHITFYVACSSSSSNDFQMSVPFTNSNNGSWNPITLQNNGSGTSLIGRIDESSTLLRVITHTSDDKQSYNDLNGEWVIGAGTYITDSY